MHLFTKIPLFISCRHNATLQGNTSQLNKQMPGLFTICFNPSLNAEAIISNAPNKHLHLLAIAALHLTPHVLQWPNDPPGQGGRDARCQQWADQRPLELFREVPSAWIHRYEESRHQAHGSDPSYAKTLCTGIVTVRIWITLRVPHLWWSCSCIIYLHARCLLL